MIQRNEITQEVAANAEASAGAAEELANFGSEKSRISRLDCRPVINKSQMKDLAALDVHYNIQESDFKTG